MNARSLKMFLVLGLLTIVATVPEGLGLSVSPAAAAQKIATNPVHHRAGELAHHRAEHMAHPQIDMEAFWDEFSVATDSPPEVLIPSLGVTMIGKLMVTQNNRTLAAYQGIKYGIAERFQHSVDSGRYWGDASQLTVDHLGEKCSQISLLGHFGTGSEDCLFLNIYVPMIDDAAPVDLLPVMFFIHGGWFTSGDTSTYLPTRLLDKDVILVAIQYRLGALGWLSLQNENIPGNAGLSDQITALKWVKTHIPSFGGDPDRVTIFGESAGSTSVSLLQTIGPVTEGLFAGAIGQSGSSLVSWAIDEEPLKSAWKFSEICGCSATSEGEILDCLMAKTHGDISVCTHDMVMLQRRSGDVCPDATLPVVQSFTVPEEFRLITKMPSEYIEAGEAVDVPLMMGTTRDEGSYIFAVLYLDFFVPNGLVNDSDYLENNVITDVMAAFGMDDPTHVLTPLMQDKYFPGVNMSSFDDICPGMIDMTGVLFLKSGNYEVAKLHSTYYSSNTFFYSFDYVSDKSMFDYIFVGHLEEIPFDHGVTHSDDLMYLFPFPIVLDERQHLTSQQMVTLWTNFAIYGNPTPDEVDNYSELGLPKWKMLDPEELHYLLIQDVVTVESDYTKRWTIQMDLLNPDEPISTSSPGGPSF